MALKVWLPLNKDIQILPVLSTSMAKESGISITEENGWFKIADASHTSSRWGAYMDFEVEPGLTYILSCDLKAGTRSAKVGFDSFAGSRSWPTDRITSSSTTGERKSYTLVTARGKYARVYFNLAPTALGDYAYFKNPTLTKITNLGISNINITEVSTSAINENTGKIGKCLTDNGTAYWAISPITLGSNCSVCCWTKTSINGKMSWVLESNANATLNLYESTYYALNIGDGNGNLFKDNNGNSITCLHDGKWHHFVVTFDGTSALLYIDGEYRGKAITFRNPTTTNGRIKLGGGYNNSHSYDWNGDLNDFRIYDHCLSPLEVKEISQGLILHYKLDGFSGGTGDNLATNTLFPLNTISGYLNSKAVEYNHSNWTSGGRYFASYTGSKLKFTEIEANQPYTISAWVYIYDDVVVSNPGGTSIFYRVYKTGESPTYSYDIATSLSGITTRNQWVRVSSTFISPVSYTYNQGGVFQIGGYNAHFLVSMPKVEKGSVATPWSPAPEDLGIDTTRITDSSGYGNNGIITGNLITNNNSKRYLNSTTFNGSSNISLTNFYIGNEWSYGCWIYSPTSSRGWEGIIILNNNGGDSDTQLGFYTNPGGNRIQNTANGQYNSGIAMTYGQWNHFFGTFDGSNLKTYINGVLVNTKAITNTLLSKFNLTIGARSSNVNGAAVSAAYPFLGELSDVRIYTTALSAEDILDLYHTPANIDNLGGIHGFEMDEEQANIFRYELINPYAKNPSAVGTGEWSLRNGEWAMNIKPAPFYQNLADNKSGFLGNEFKPNTQYVFNLWIDGDDVIHNNNNVACGLAVIYSDGSIENLIVTGGSKGFQHKVYISDASKSVNRVSSYYYVSIDVFYRWDSYICPADKESIVKEGLIKSTQFIENNSLASIHESGSMLSSNIIEK